MKEEVRDGYLSDLPEDVRIKVMNVHKMIVDEINNEFKRKKYDAIRNQQWAKSMIDEFCTVPGNKSNAGSVRVYKKGKRYRCMIQMTNHVPNNRNTENEELFHGFIRNTHTALRAKVRRKFDVTIECESIHGEPFEGYDIWTKPKVAKDIWEKFGDKKTKTVMKESADVIVAGRDELPIGLQQYIESTRVLLESELGCSIDDYGFTVIRNYDESYTGSIVLTPVLEGVEQSAILKALDNCSEKLYNEDTTKILTLDEGRTFEYLLEPEYCKALYEWLNNSEIELTEASHGKLKMELRDYSIFVPEGYNARNACIAEKENCVWDPFAESKHGMVSDMSSSEAKKTLRAVSKKVIDSYNNDSNYKVTQYTANIYANIITKNLLHSWSEGYRKFSIILDTYKKDNVLEFKVPSMTKDFVARFVEGRENMNGFLHRDPEIVIKMSPSIFATMTDVDDAYNFFKAAIKYYDKGITKYSEKLMNEVMKLNVEMKHLIATTQLSGVVTFPMRILFVFDDVSMHDKTTFKIEKDDINAINNFVHNIYSRYAAPEKEKKQIIEDLRKMIDTFNEYVEINEDRYLPEAVESLFTGQFDDEIRTCKEKFLQENVDTSWPKNTNDHEIVMIAEKFGVKKLKRIPKDLVAYISIEAENIHDANDKMMIASYCLSKLEIVEWYIELLETGSKKYIVPHTKPELESIRTQLLACYKKIMAVKITPPGDRPIIDIRYPKGYEG